MRLRDRVLGASTVPKRSLDSIMDFYGVAGNQYPLTFTWPTGPEEDAPNDYRGFAQLLRSNPIVFACFLTRVSLFSEARFAFRRIRNGVPGDLFGTAELAVLEKPDFNVTTGGLLTRMEQDVALVGNSFNWRAPGSNRILRLKPQYTSIVLGSRIAGIDNPGDDPEVTVLGYLYDPKRGQEPMFFPPDEVAHFAPMKDPDATFRGMSWLSPVVSEVGADDQATSFKQQFYRNNATSNMVVTVDKNVTFENFEKFKAMFEEEHRGVANAYKTIFLGGGADAKVVGSNFEQMAYTDVQSHGENRICIASGVPAVMVGLQSGLDAATYSNMGQARRVFADGTARPWWREAAASLETIVKVPSDARLDVDVDDIAFLRDDGKDIAEIQMGQAGAIKQLTEAGFTPDSVVDAVVANDLSRLKGNHSGLQSVQLVPPANGQSMNGADMPTNGAQPAVTT